MIEFIAETVFRTRNNLGATVSGVSLARECFGLGKSLVLFFARTCS